MPQTILRQGTHGGVSLIDETNRERRDSEIDEKDNVRTGDRLDEIINTVTKGKFAGRIDNKTFRYNTEGVSRTLDVTYDREYIGFKLLVDFFSLAAKNTTMQDEVHREIAFKEKFAQGIGYRYLPIIESQFDVGQLKALLA